MTYFGNSAFTGRPAALPRRGEPRPLWRYQELTEPAHLLATGPVAVQRPAGLWRAESGESESVTARSVLDKGPRHACGGSRVKPGRDRSRTGAAQRHNT